MFKAEGTELTENFKKLLASPTIASKRWITEQYDSMVRTNTIAGPEASDAAVVRIKDPKTGIVKRALALATDGNGRWCQLNPRVGAMHAVAEAARKERARKQEKQKTAKHVYTEEDLKHPNILTPEDREQIEAKRTECAQKNNCSPAQNPPATLDANSPATGTPSDSETSLGEVARQLRKQKELQE